jgi:hypothetical protein
MSYYRLIPPSCIVSATARRVYLACGQVSVAFAALVMWSASTGSNVFQTQLGTILLPLGATSIALLVVGMECFLFMYDDSRAWKQVLWFVALAIIPFGTVLYCFRVYRSKTPMTAEQISRAASVGL